MNRFRQAAPQLLILALIAAASGCKTASKSEYGGVPGANQRVPASDQGRLEWNDYGGIRTADRMGEKFSTLDEINTGNVKELKQIWTYNTRAHKDPKSNEIVNERTIPGPKSLEVTPIYHDGKLYGCSIFNTVFALDADTGKEIWWHDPKVRRSDKVWAYKCRGVAIWTDPGATGMCSTRVISSTIDGRLLALDASTGERCPGFVERMNGQPVDGAPMGEVAPWVNVMVDDTGHVGPKDNAERVAFVTGKKDHPYRDEYYITSAPLVYKDLILIGGGIADNGRVNATAGGVQAFDVRTGELRWFWDPVPDSMYQKGKLHSGTPNVWPPMSADESRGLVFLPTGTAAPDYFGANRSGKDKYANSVVALRVEENGRLLAEPRVEWHFKTVIQDKWDYDVSSQPVLTNLNVSGKEVPVVIQATKMGFVFIMHRETGKPIFPTKNGVVTSSYYDLLKTVSTEGVVPEETIIDDHNALITDTKDGKVTWGLKKMGSHSKFQPFPPPEWQLHDTPNDKKGLQGTLAGFNAKCKELTKQYNYSGIYTPPSLVGGINFPGAVGGVDWGGVTIDPMNNMLYVNQIRIATIAKLYKRAEYKAVLAKAGPAGPKAFKEAYFDMAGTPYGLHRFPYMDPDSKLPCSDPPYGTLKAVSLVNGQPAWPERNKKYMFGDFAEMTKHVVEQKAKEEQAHSGEMAAAPPSAIQKFFKGAVVGIHSREAGVPNFGGALATKGGILFIAAAADSSFRMYDSRTGEQIHEIRLDQFEGAGAGAATPMTFMSKSNRQIVVVASGGNKFIPGKQGDAIVAFARK